MYIIDNAAKLVLTAEQTAEIEHLAEETGVDTLGGWEGEAQIRFNAVKATLIPNNVSSGLSSPACA